MIDNNDYEKVINRFYKGSRLENERTFRGTFTKYMIDSRKFVENKNKRSHNFCPYRNRTCENIGTFFSLIFCK